jgi:hypothetical protein
MAHESAPSQTRIWWDDSEVEFIRWSEKSLVFSWGNVTETAVHLPRGAVVRLLRKGVLRVEGTLPDWVNDPLDSDLIGEHHQPIHTARHFEPIMLVDIPPEPVDLAPSIPAAAPHVDGSGGRFNAIARLIRKLGGPGRPVS